MDVRESRTTEPDTRNPELDSTMPERECPSCALPVDASAEVCPYCEYEFPRRSTGVKSMAWLFALLMLWPVIEVILWLFG